MSYGPGKCSFGFGNSTMASTCKLVLGQRRPSAQGSTGPRVQGSTGPRVDGTRCATVHAPSSWISKIGMHANTFLIESFKWWSIASGAVRCSCFPFCSTCLVQSSRASFICFVRSFCTDVLNKLCDADRIGAVAYVGVFGAKYQQSTIG